MPITYRIELDRRLVVSTAFGVLTDAELLAHKNRLAADPLFRSDLRELGDGRSVERLEVTLDGIRAMVSCDAALGAARSPQKLALVLSEDLAFGMARMYQGMRGSDNNGAVGVFRDINEARIWLEAD